MAAMPSSRPMPDLLHAPERCFGVHRRVAVHRDDARADPLGDPQRPPDVPRPDRPREPVGRVVGQSDRVRLVIERDDRDHGSEDLLLHDAHARSGAIEDRRRDVAAGVHTSARHSLAARDQPAAFGLADRDVVEDPLHVPLADQGTHLGRIIRRVADPDRPSGACERLHDLLMDRPLHQDPTAGAAVLARIIEHGIGRLAGEPLQVRVREYHVGALATQLQADLLDRARRESQDLLSGSGLSRERDLADTRMCSEGRTRHGTRARHDVDDPVREPGLQAQLAQSERRERRPRCRLEDGGVARRQGGRELPGGHHQREVPGHDEADDADRLAQRQVQPGLGHRDGLTVVLVRGPTEVFEDPCGGADLPAGAADGFADVA